MRKSRSHFPLCNFRVELFFEINSQFKVSFVVSIPALRAHYGIVAFIQLSSFQPDACAILHIGSSKIRAENFESGVTFFLSSIF